MKRWEEIGKNRVFSAIFPQLGVCSFVIGAFCIKKDTDSLILIDSDELRKKCGKRG
ncbi:MAG: hypothetical protein ACRCSV_01190 [Chlamydiales bacterium]